MQHHSIAVSESVNKHLFSALNLPLSNNNNNNKNNNKQTFQNAKLTLKTHTDACSGYNQVHLVSVKQISFQQLSEVQQ